MFSFQEGASSGRERMLNRRLPDGVGTNGFAEGQHFPSVCNSLSQVATCYPHFTHMFLTYIAQHLYEVVPYTYIQSHIYIYIYIYRCMVVPYTYI